jgi:hypothetical protein
VHLVVIDAGTLAALPSPRRVALMAEMQDVTVPGGIHVLMPTAGGAAEAWVSLYPDWERIPVPTRANRRGKRESSPGVLLSRPLPKPTARASSTA